MQYPAPKRILRQEVVEEEHKDDACFVTDCVSLGYCDIIVTFFFLRVSTHAVWVSVWPPLEQYSNT